MNQTLFKIWQLYRLKTNKGWKMETFEYPDPITLTGFKLRLNPRVFDPEVMKEQSIAAVLIRPLHD